MMMTHIGHHMTPLDFFSMGVLIVVPVGIVVLSYRFVYKYYLVPERAKREQK